MNINELKSLVRSFENVTDIFKPQISQSAVENALIFLDHLDLRGIIPTSVDAVNHIRFNFAHAKIDVLFLNDGQISENNYSEGMGSSLVVLSREIGKLAEKLAKS